MSSDSAASAKIFAEFVALIVRNRLYTLLKDEAVKLDKDPNYLTVPAALKELEKIEMIRGLDGRYRMDHAVTKTPKEILEAFGIDAHYVRNAANELSASLAKEG